MSLEPAIAAMLVGQTLGVTLKVVHSVLDALNRRRVPSRERLVTVDGADGVDNVAEFATRLVQQIEQRERRALVDLPAETVRKYSQELLAVADDKARLELPAVDESKIGTLLDDMRKATILTIES